MQHVYPSDMLQHLLGNDTIVYLDIFQRILKHMPKRHPLYSHCKSRPTLYWRAMIDEYTQQYSRAAWSGLWYDPVSALVSFPDSWHQTRLPQLSLVMCLRDYPACGLRVRFQIVCLVEGCVSHCKAIVRTLPPGSFLRDREKWPKKRPQVCYPQEKTVLWLTWIGELLSGSPSSYVTIPKIWVGSDHARLLI